MFRLNSRRKFIRYVKIVLTVFIACGQVTIERRRLCHETILSLSYYLLSYLFAKPLWEEPVSEYVDHLIFKASSMKNSSHLLTKDSLTDAVHYIS